MTKGTQMNRLNLLFLVEDDPKDIRLATETARSVGISSIEARTTLDAAKSYLERGLANEIPLPDLILLDLNLGYDNGQELMREWHSNSRLSRIPLIVWSVLEGEDQRRMCELFKVTAYVAKWEGVAALRDAFNTIGHAEP